MNEHVRALLDDMDESYEAMGYLPLYELMWTLRGYGTVPAAEMEQVAQAAYDTFTSQRHTRLVWTRWPIDLGEAWPVQPDTPLDFDADPDAPVDTPMLVLVPE